MASADVALIAVSMQGDTVDALCWRHLGRTQGVVEATLKLNPGLADMGLVLPTGTSVKLARPASSKTKTTVQLWD